MDANAWKRFTNGPGVPEGIPGPVYFYSIIVSKNGNLMLSVPVRGDGIIATDEVKIVGETGAWLKINGSAIYGTRPWQVYGEGPAMNVFEKGHFDGQKDTFKTPFTPAGMRFTQTKIGDTLYAIILASPTDGQVTIKSLAEKSTYWPGQISRVSLAGSRVHLEFSRDSAGLHVQLPKKCPGILFLLWPSPIEIMVKIRYGAAHIRGTHGGRSHRPAFHSRQRACQPPDSCPENLGLASMVSRPAETGGAAKLTTTKLTHCRYHDAYTICRPPKYFIFSRHQK